MNLDNRNKKITKEPEVQEIINDTPEKEPDLEELDIEEEKEPEVDPEPSTPPIEDEPEVKKETPEPEEPKKEAKKENIDYKNKFVESSKEALTLHFKNQQLTNAIDEASTLPDPTEEELISYAKENGAEYEYLDDFSKSMLKRTLINERRFSKIDNVNKEAKNYQAWVEKVDNFIDSPEVVNSYPDIEDHAEDFRKFCLKNERRGMVLADLASSFLYGLIQQPKEGSKKTILLSGGNGQGTDPKPQGMTEEDASLIRKSNPQEYRRLIKAGKIKIDI